MEHERAFFFFFFVCVEGFVHFLHIVAKGSYAFSKINGLILDEANRRY